MAEHTSTRRSRRTSAALLSAAMIGSVTAAAGVAVPAFADEDYPSWDEVAKAKLSEATKAKEIENLTGLLTGLRESSAVASQGSQMAAEAYRVTQDDLDAATAREESLDKQSAVAQKAADTSKMRAGLIAAHLAKTGAQDLSLNLFLNGNTADDLLSQLGTASKLSEQSETIYRQAVQDKNTAESLIAQAAAATAERKRLSAESKEKYESASDAALGAQAALDVELKKSSELYEQLALLKDTTADVEREYQTGLDAAASAAALAKAQAAAAAAVKNNPPAASAPAAPGAAAPAPAAPAPAAPAPAAPAPAAPAPAAPAPAAPAPPVASAPAAPNASAVGTAIAFARAQLGDAYKLGGSGPDVWDCSGLTKAAYAAAGIYIGTHSATNHYNTMAGQGKLVSFSQVQVGDLVFWGSPGNYYHVAIYVGGGQILEAPDVGKPVRVHSIWSPGQVAPYVGRPS
ncbi:cell wall-associated NlpC family hydrolase [Cryobacterium sp. MP_3.1]|uniref:C40 family peptidase n=1 Tax=Cryobacterium sp. MP_3.1 TaxID=3071711 RepID=UPI002E03D4DF|nr:cell wall-associated NlpC family hydrolase [Cryobacterium sp. MP_3.1]